MGVGLRIGEPVVVLAEVAVATSDSNSAAAIEGHSAGIIMAW